MLDRNYLLEHAKLVKENIAKRNKPDKVKLVDDFLRADTDWRKIKSQLDQLRHRRNILSQEINTAKKNNKNVVPLVAEAKGLPQKVADLEKNEQELAGKIHDLIMRIPNIMHPSVPVGADESKNPEVKKWGKIKKLDFELVSHAELAERLGFADFEAGRENTGKGFNYLIGELAQLDLALQRYGIDFLLEHGFVVVVPPVMLNRETLSGAVDLSAFEEVIYKIEGEDLYLIGTAEHALVSLMKNKIIPKEKLPFKICAVTPSFRKEIGGHGVDMKGIFRMHQFNKVEQVVYTLPEDSFKLLETIQGITEKFFQSLVIPYRVIEICSGDLGGKFAKQYDIEAWFPRQNAYREVTSAGNCTDYQARRLNITTQTAEGKKHVHILNNTMVATSRAMVAILENFQNKDGTVTIPKVLHKYTGFKKMGVKT